MLKFTIKPHDVLFFGSGKPFNNIGGDAESIFPPFPHSFASAIYAKFFAETKIVISEDKGGIYKAVYGPFLKKEKDKDKDEDGILLFPAPLDIMKERKKDNGEISKAHLKKRNGFKLINTEDTDLGNSIEGLLWTKSENKEAEFEPFKGFITLDGLKKWLNNEEVSKEDLISSEKIYQREDRISIHLEDTTRTVKEKDGLYRVSFIRLKEDVSFVFWIEANFENDSHLISNGIKNYEDLKNIFENSLKVLKLGGEARTASYEVKEDDFSSLFNNRTLKKGKIFQILFLTPAIFTQGNEDYGRTILQSINGFKVISGAIDGYVIDGISFKNYKNDAHLSNKTNKINKTVRAIKPGSFLYVKEYNPTKCLDFIGNSNLFIGSNLVLIKEI